MSDLRSLLDADELRTLRAGYDRALMGKLAVGAVGAPYAPAMPWAQAVGDAYYLDPGDDDARLRETVVLALLAAQRTPGQLAIHVYWALMEGHTVGDVLRILHLVGCYNGLPAWTIGQGVAGRVLRLLAARARSGAPEQVDCRAVVGAIVSEIPG